jgi:hypothetical protein
MPDPKRKQQQQCQHHNKLQAQRIKEAEAAAIAAKPPTPSPPKVSKRAPRTKTQRRNARGRSAPPPLNSQPEPSPSATKKRKKYTTTTADNLRQAVEYYDSRRGGDNHMSKSAVARQFRIEPRTFSIMFVTMLPIERQLDRSLGRRALLMRRMPTLLCNTRLVLTKPTRGYVVKTSSKTSILFGLTQTMN